MNRQTISFLRRAISVLIAAVVIFVLVLFVGRLAYRGSKSTPSPEDSHKISGRNNSQLVTTSSLPEITSNYHIPTRLTFNIRSFSAEILVTDPTGKSTGYDPNTGQLVTEIPDSTYEVEGGISDPENQDIHTPTFHSLFIPNPIDGTYQVTVIGTGAGPYTLEAGDLIVREAQGVIQPGDKLKYHFEYSTTDDNKIVLKKISN
jgi:hypothetical protein